MPVLRDTSLPPRPRFTTPRTYSQYTLPAPKNGRTRRVMAGARAKLLVLICFCLWVGTGAKGVRETMPTHQVGPLAHLLTHKRYVVWYQGPSVYTCRDTYVASVEKRKSKPQQSQKENRRVTHKFVVHSCVQTVFSLFSYQSLPGSDLNK